MKKLRNDKESNFWRVIEMDPLKKFKWFECECGYYSVRSNNNQHCKKCGKEGRLIKLIKKEL